MFFVITSKEFECALRLYQTTGKKNVLRISLKRCKSMYKVIFLEEYHTRSGDGG